MRVESNLDVISILRHSKEVVAHIGSGLGDVTQER
jgi:hypothetical protein